MPARWALATSSCAAAFGRPNYFKEAAVEGNRRARIGRTLSVTFGGGLCIFGTSTLPGIAYYDVPTHQLYAIAPNAARTDGFLAVGVKQ